MDKIVAIHQPNFFPWLGYFDKIARSNIFVFFDNVQFPKKGGSWSNRVKLLIAGDSKWVTASIERNYSGLRNINEMYFQDDHWRTKMLKSIVTNYNKHPFFKETMEVIEPLVLNPERNIAEFNMNAVLEIAKKIDLDISNIRKSSEFLFPYNSNELLCEITKTVGGNTYMCGGGADGYQQGQVYKDFGISLLYQNFKHAQYPQRGCNCFAPGLSIIDVAMNLGWNNIKSLLKIKNC